MDKILDVFELYADTDKRKVDAFNSKLSSKMNIRIETDKTKQDVLWIDVMENTIEYIDNILRNPMRLIINEEEVVKIEKIKKVTVESIKHLSKNAGFIEDVDENGDVILDENDDVVGQGGEWNGDKGCRHTVQGVL